MKEHAKEAATWIVGGTLTIGLLIGLTWALTGNHLLLHRGFAPQFEAARRETFEQSRAYRQGAVQELQAMRLDYSAASKEHKTALRSVILHRSADLDESAMPNDLRDFIRGLREDASR